MHYFTYGSYPDLDVHVDISIMLLLSSFIVYASHTQYIIRTDVRSWTLCSCPQVDRELSLTQIHSPDS